MVRPNTNLKETFHAAGRRLTSQRRLILRVLEESDGHLDVETVHRRAKRQNAEISLATVYRALAVLKEIGLVREHRLGEEHAHYEAANDHPHYHFTCLGCGQVIEFDTPLIDRVIQSVHERHRAQILDVHLHLSGYCEQCQRSNNGGSYNDET